MTVVILDPGDDLELDEGERHEHGLVHKFVAHSVVKLAARLFCNGLPRAV